uniref:Putative quinone-oxidoreductase homologic n=1 Tax=Rhizophora mucronata TaxID=61149 RepID=A0A2P2LEM5_RHIMU
MQLNTAVVNYRNCKNQSHTLPTKSRPQRINFLYYSGYTNSFNPVPE